MLAFVSVHRCMELRWRQRWPGGVTPKLACCNCVRDRKTTGLMYGDPHERRVILFSCFEVRREVRLCVFFLGYFMQERGLNDS